MNGEQLAIKERDKDQQAICSSIGGQAIADCMTKCSPEVIASCPLMALKQRQSELVTASPRDVKPAASDAGYIDGGGGADVQRPRPQVTVPQNIPPKPDIQEQRAAKERAAAEQAMRERLRRLSHVPQRQPSGQALKHRTFLELLLDGVIELVVADSLRQK